MELDVGKRCLGIASGVLAGWVMAVGVAVVAGLVMAVWRS